MHKPVHNEGRTGHISRIFKKGYEQVEYQYVREEDQHAAHTSDDSVHHKVLQPAVCHRRGNKGREVPDQPLDPPHRVLADGKGSVKYDI